MDPKMKHCGALQTLNWSLVESSSHTDLHMNKARHWHQHNKLFGDYAENNMKNDFVGHRTLFFFVRSLTWVTFQTLI